jgi:hypothetical protein
MDAVVVVVAVVDVVVALAVVVVNVYCFTDVLLKLCVAFNKTIFSLETLKFVFKAKNKH